MDQEGVKSRGCALYVAHRCLNVFIQMFGLEKLTFKLDTFINFKMHAK